MSARPTQFVSAVWDRAWVNSRGLLALALALAAISGVAWWYGEVATSAVCAAASLAVLWIRAPSDPGNVAAVAAGLAALAAVSWWYGAVGLPAAFAAAAIFVLWVRSPTDPRLVILVAAALTTSGALAWWYDESKLAAALGLAGVAVLWLRWPMRPPRTPMMPAAAAGLALLSFGAWWFGFEAVGFAAAAGAALALGVWCPIAPVFLVFVFAGAFGGFGGHWSAPGGSVPLFELLLVASAVGTVVSLRTGWAERDREGTWLVVLWLPAALYAGALVLFLNQRDFVSGAREAILLGYPLLIALPFATVDSRRLRAFIEDHGYKLLAGIALAATLTGAINFAIGNTVDTSTGQPRALPGEFSAPLGAGLLAAVWLVLGQRRYRLGFLLAAVSVLGLLMVNHRSAYLAVVAAFVVVALTGGLLKAVRANPRRTARTAAVFTVCGGLLLAVTPLGRNGVERFAGLFDRGDENYSFREDALSQALEKNSAGEVIFGNGVGLQPTDLGDKYIYDLSEATLNVRRIEAHNSFAAIYHRAGLIGLALVAVPILVLVRRMMRRRQDMTVSMFLAFVAFMTVMAFFNVVLENSFFGIWFWLPLFVGALLAASPHVAET